jgi:hypothetical protein
MLPERVRQVPFGTCIRATHRHLEGVRSCRDGAADRGWPARTRTSSGPLGGSSPLVDRFTGKPTGETTGETTTITVATTGPQRGFSVELTPGGVALTPGAAAANPDVELPAEAFARLVYGRLDAEHTPSREHGSALDILRRLFPGP